MSSQACGMVADDTIVARWFLEISVYVVFFFGVTMSVSAFEIRWLLGPSFALHHGRIPGRLSITERWRDVTEFRAPCKYLAMADAVCKQFCQLRPSASKFLWNSCKISQITTHKGRQSSAGGGTELSGIRNVTIYNGDEME